MIRIMPLAPGPVTASSNQQPRQGQSASTSSSSHRPVSSNSMLGFCGSRPLSSSTSNAPKRVNSAELQLLDRRFNGLPMAGGPFNSSLSQHSRKRARPYSHSDIGLPVRVTSTGTSSTHTRVSVGGGGSRVSISQPLPSLPQSQQYRHSLKLQHGTSGQFLGDGGFNIRLGQRWSLDNGSKTAPVRSTLTTKAGSRKGASGKRSPTLQDIGIRPLPSSPKRSPSPAPTNAPARRAYTYGSRPVISERIRTNAAENYLHFGYKGACINTSERRAAGTDLEASTSSGSSPSTNSAPGWLDHVKGPAILKLNTPPSDSDSDSDGTLSNLSDSDDDGLLDISVDSGIDSVEHKKLLAEQRAARKAAAAVKRGRTAAQRDIYRIGDDEDDDAEMFPEAFFTYQRSHRIRQQEEKRPDYFSGLPDEMIMKVLTWLPKTALGRIAQVSRRFKRVASDESLWTHIDCQSKNLSWEQLDSVLQRNPLYLRMARASIHVLPLNKSCKGAAQLNMELPQLAMSPQLSFLDLSLAIATPAMINGILGTCTGLTMLSLEHCEITSEILNTATVTFAHSLDTLNLTMCYINGSSTAEAFVGLLAASKNLKILNMGCVKQEWRGSEIMNIMSSYPTGLEQLNIAGFRLQLTDTHIQVMTSRCPNLVELDISDSQGITMMSIEAVSHLQAVQHLGLSRCYSVEPESYPLLKNMKSLRFLELFSIFKDDQAAMFTALLHGVQLNQFPFSAIARPTCGSKRSSIWGQRVRD